MGERSVKHFMDVVGIDNDIYVYKSLSHKNT